MSKPVKDSMIELEGSSEDEPNIKRKVQNERVQESLVELLRSIDLKTAKDEINMGFMGCSKEDVEKAKQISKIRARVHHKNK